MPTGISESFLLVTDREERSRWKQAGILVVVGAGALFLAELSDSPPAGTTVRVFGLSLVAGLVLGVAITLARLHRYEGSLKERWRHWMRAADGQGGLEDVWRRVGKRPPRSAVLLAAQWTLLALVNALLFLLLWFESTLASSLAPALLSLDGLLLGAAFSAAVATARWCRNLRSAADELLGEGAIAIWGER